MVEKIYTYRNRRLEELTKEELIVALKDQTDLMKKMRYFREQEKGMLELFDYMRSGRS